METNIPKNTTRLKALFFIGLISGIKIIAAFFLQLGNDEVYYLQYARFPDLSHFDHPPMVGWMIQITTLNLLFSSDVLVRLGPILISGLTSLILFRIARRLDGDTSGLIALLLFHSSPYFSVVSGFFAMPDAALVLFLALALEQAMLFSISERSLKGQNLMYFGLFVGIASLSKYTALFYWLAMLSSLALYHRDQLLKPRLYASLVITMICLLPVIWWNWLHDFQSFSFHSERAVWQGEIRWDYFFREMMGQVLMASPILFLVLMYRLMHYRALKTIIGKKQASLLFLSFFPISITFLGIALTRPSLLHWSGPAYLSATLMASVWLSEKIKMRVLRLSIAGYILNMLLIILGTIIIQTGILSGKLSPEKDVSLDMYGWDQAKPALLTRLPMLKERQTCFACSNWFPAAHFDHYLAGPLGKKLYVSGSLHRTHKFFEVNLHNGDIPAGSDLVLLSHTRHKRMDTTLFIPYFNEASGLDSIPILRQEKVAGYFYYYHLKEAKTLIPATFFNQDE